MIKLLKNYINLLSIDKIDSFCNSNNIVLNQNEKEYILNLIKDNFEDILINDSRYIKDLESNINTDAYNKIIKLYNYYKEKYRDYLF